MQRYQPQVQEIMYNLPFETSGVKALGATLITMVFVDFLSSFIEFSNNNRETVNVMDGIVKYGVNDIVTIANYHQFNINLQRVTPIFNDFYSSRIPCLIRMQSLINQIDSRLGLIWMDGGVTLISGGNITSLALLGTMKAMLTIVLQSIYLPYEMMCNAFNALAGAGVIDPWNNISSSQYIEVIEKIIGHLVDLIERIQDRMVDYNPDGYTDEWMLNSDNFQIFDRMSFT